MKRNTFSILTILLLLITLTACGMPLQKSTGSPKKDVQAPTDSPKKDVQAPTDSPKKDVQVPMEQLDLSPQENILAQRQARQLLAEQDYVGTINLIQDEIRRGIDEHTLAKEYLQAANHSLVQADTLMSQEHYPQAALLLKTVQDSYPESIELQQQISASPAQVANKINLCTEELMEEGLIAYRSGEFTTAINVWEQVLAFNPGHKAAQSSIQTTQLQLSNLKSLDNKN